MKRCRILRVPSRHDVCFFCASRQPPSPRAAIASTNYIPHRSLGSSSRTNQYAEEGMLQKEAPAPPTRRLTQAERMRQLLQAAAQQQRQQAQSQARQTHQTERSTNLHAALWPERQQRTTSRTFPEQQFSGRHAPRDSLIPRASKAVPHEQRSGRPLVRSVRGDPRNEARSAAPSRGHTHFDMARDSQVQNIPSFNRGQLRRRNEPRTPTTSEFKSISKEQSAVGTPAIQDDQSELDRLLHSVPGSTSKQSARSSYTPLTREPRQEARLQSKCYHCGREGHRGFECPTKATIQPQPPREQRYGQSRSDVSADMHIPMHPRADESSAKTQSPQQERDNKRRNFAGFADGRSSEETWNRYEQPERRSRKNNGSQRHRQRVARDQMDEDEEMEMVDRAEQRRQRREERKRLQESVNAPAPIRLPQYISVTHLASLLKVRLEDFVAKLEELGFEDVQHDHVLNAEHAGLIAQEYNFEPIVQGDENVGDLFPAPAPSAEDYGQLPARPPVVTIMGHVDHGKTTILDYMRSTSVAASEFGGITQHIGAFSVPLASGKRITFLDTPGHAAFETMRARGANVTDIVVLVVAADDSVMPQTVEAIKHAQAAKVPIIVAINKIDKSQANSDAVKMDLGRHGIEIEDFGGDVQVVCVSGKTGQGIADLEEAITTLSETLDHRADPRSAVEGWVLEGATKNFGKVATVLVRSGTLHVGDVLVAGATWTRVRSLRNEGGVTVTEVGPGLPVEVDGWRDQPIAGDEVLQAVDEHQGQSVAELRQEKLERAKMAEDMDAINQSRKLEAERRDAEEAAARGVEAEEAKETQSGPEIVSFIIKGDVSGSVEAVIDGVASIGNAEIGTRILRHGVGAPSEFDVQHAADAGGYILNFNTTIAPNIAALAEEKGVKILDSNIIYRMTESVRALLEEKLPPRLSQRVTGEAEVAMTFSIGLGGKRTLQVAGSKVRNGVVAKGSRVRVTRDEAVVYDGTISSLKSQKKDVDQMRKDTECGIAFEGWDEFQPKDKIQCYEEEKHRRTL